MQTAQHPVRILNFVSKLLPNLERSSVLEDVQMLRDAVSSTLLPAFKQAATVIHDRKFSSQLVSDFDEVFRLNVPTYQRVGYINGMVAFYTTMIDKLDLILKLIPEEFAKDITRESLTYRKTALLQYVSVVRFVNEYSSRAMLRLVAAEQKAQLGQVDEIDSQLSQGEKTWLVENQTPYFQAIQFLSIPLKDLSSAFEKIPAVTVMPERIHEVAQTIGASNIDPLKLGLISGTWNPIYHLRSFLVERQVEAYQADKETKRALELRLLALRKSYDGSQDARVEQQIEYTEARLKRINHSIQEMERHAH